MGLSLDGWYNGTDTSDRVRDDMSWKDFWLMKTGEKSFGKCRVASCNNSAEIGAHVWNKDEATLMKNGKYSVKYRIVPMCKECNKLNLEFSLKGEVKFPLEELE